jgi:hypothetical protein
MEGRLGRKSASFEVTPSHIKSDQIDTKIKII